MTPLEDCRKIGGRVLVKGQVVTIAGERGEFSICGFRGDEVHVYGGPAGRQRFRAFTTDRLGRRPRHPRIRKETR